MEKETSRQILDKWVKLPETCSWYPKIGAVYVPNGLRKNSRSLKDLKIKIVKRVDKVVGRRYSNPVVVVYVETKRYVGIKTLKELGEA